MEGSRPQFYANMSDVRIDGNLLSVRIHHGILDIVRIKEQKAKSEGDKWQIRYEFERKRKPRTTGPESQSAHLHGHLKTIADSLGYYMSEIKEAMKEDISDWPRKTIIVGNTRKTVYMSEADADTILEAKAIEWCHIKAAELNIRLIEKESV